MNSFPRRVCFFVNGFLKVNNMTNSFKKYFQHLDEIEFYDIERVSFKDGKLNIFSSLITLDGDVLKVTVDSVDIKDKSIVFLFDNCYINDSLMHILRNHFEVVSTRLPAEKGVDWNGIINRLFQSEFQFINSEDQLVKAAQRYDGDFTLFDLYSPSLKYHFISQKDENLLSAFNTLKSLSKTCVLTKNYSKSDVNTSLKSVFHDEAFDIYHLHNYYFCKKNNNIFELDSLQTKLLNFLRVLGLDSFRFSYHQGVAHIYSTNPLEYLNALHNIES